MQILPQAFALHTNYQRNRKGLEASMARLASGDRLMDAGNGSPADLSISERFRHQIRRAEASTSGIQTALNFLRATDGYMDEVVGILNRMEDVAARATAELKNSDDRKAHQIEFNALQQDLTSLARNARFGGNSQIGSDVMASYDANTEYFKFWRENGDGGEQITRKFDAQATDIRGNLIGFDSSEDFTISRDGKSLYFLAHVTGDAGGTVRLKSYDIEGNILTTSTDLYATGDTLFETESGQLYINGAGTLYSIASDNLAQTASAVADLTTGTQFSVYKDDVYYYRSSDSHLVKSVIATAVATDLVDPSGFAAGDHTIAASGKYAAEESVAGSIRVIDTRTGNESTIAIGAANDVTNMHFNEAGDRIYYVNQNTNSINFVAVTTDENDNVILVDGGKVVQGINANSFQGLDLGGANPASERTFTLAADSVSELSYGGVDLSLYALGLANTRVDSIADAESALEDIKEALNRANAARAKIRAQSSRFTFVLQGHRQWTANMVNTESSIRDVDVAKESINYSNAAVRTQAAQAILAQFNSMAQNVLRLLQ